MRISTDPASRTAMSLPVLASAPPSTSIGGGGGGSRIGSDGGGGGSRISGGGGAGSAAAATTPTGSTSTTPSSQTPVTPPTVTPLVLDGDTSAIAKATSLPAVISNDDLVSVDTGLTDEAPSTPSSSSSSKKTQAKRQPSSLLRRFVSRPDEPTSPRKSQPVISYDLGGSTNVTHISVSHIRNDEVVFTVRQLGGRFGGYVYGLSLVVGCVAVCMHSHRMLAHKHNRTRFTRSHTVMAVSGALGTPSLSPLVQLIEGFWVERGSSTDSIVPDQMLEFTVPVSRDAVNQLVASQTSDAKQLTTDAEFTAVASPIGSWYARFFHDREHTNYVSVNSAIGPTILSVMRDKENGRTFYRAILRYTHCTALHCTAWRCLIVWNNDSPTAYRARVSDRHKRPWDC